MRSITCGIIQHLRCQCQIQTANLKLIPSRHIKAYTTSNVFGKSVSLSFLVMGKLCLAVRDRHFVTENQMNQYLSQWVECCWFFPFTKILRTRHRVRWVPSGPVAQPAEPDNQWELIWSQDGEANRSWSKSKQQVFKKWLKPLDFDKVWVQFGTERFSLHSFHFFVFFLSYVFIFVC